MKIRNGFVSNSSSSSFCIVGYKITKEELLEKFGEYYYNTLEDLYPIVYIKSSDTDDEFVGISIKYDDLPISKLNSLAEQLNDSIDVDINEIKIYSGEKYS